MYKLPVLETLWAGYGFVWRQRKDLADYALLPVLLTSVTSVFMATTGVGQIEYFNNLAGFYSEGSSKFFKYTLLTDGGFLPTIAGSIATLIQIALFIVFSIEWYRRYLIGPRSSPLAAVFQWRLRQFRFSFYYAVTIVLILILIVILLFIFTIFADLFFDDARVVAMDYPNFIVFFAFAFLVASVMTVRFWLTLPASAVDDMRFSLRTSRQITKRNSWRIWFVVWLGTGIPFMVLSLGYTELAFEGALVSVLQNSVVLLFLSILILNIAEYAMIAAGATCLAEIYRRFRDDASSAPGPAGSRTT